MVSDPWSLPDDCFQLKTIIAVFKKNYDAKISAYDQDEGLCRVKLGFLMARFCGRRAEK